MIKKLTDLERLRLDKLVWLYLLEAGDEDSCSVGSLGAQDTTALVSIMKQQGVNVDSETVEAIASGRLGISDPLAAAIEECFNMSAGWLSQP